MTKISSLEELRKFVKQSKEEQKPSVTYDNSWRLYYPFFKMDNDTTAIVRFIPDADDTNPGFLVKNTYHEFTINGRKKRVPCLEAMYGKPCKACELSRKFYEEENKDLGYKYYRTYEYVGAIVVVKSPFEFQDENGIKAYSSLELLDKEVEKDGVMIKGNPVRLISLSKGGKIYDKIDHELTSEDTELSVIPWDIDNGHDFKIKSTANGKYSSYTLSEFSKKVTSIEDERLAEYVRNNLIDLSKHKMKEISQEEMEQVCEAAYNSLLNGKVPTPSDDHQNNQGGDNTPPLKHSENSHTDQDAMKSAVMQRLKLAQQNRQ